MAFPQELIGGYSRFRGGRLAAERDRYRTLAEEGQRPGTMVIACCDSRAAPETIFDMGPGELFVVRNVANLVPEYDPKNGQHAASAAIEFAIAALGVRTIVVLGHARCGGIAASLDADMQPLTEANFIGRWIGPLKGEAAEVRALDRMDPAERQTEMERRGVRGSIERLSRFPQVRDAVEGGTLELHGAWFDIATGELWVMDTNTGEFTRTNG